MSRVTPLLALALLACKHPESEDSGTDSEASSWTFRGAVPVGARGGSASADGVLVVAHRRGLVHPGQLQVVPIADDGSFAFEIGTEFAYTPLLIDSTAPPRQRVTGLVALGLDAGSLLAVDGGVVQSDIDAGLLALAGDEAVSDTTTAEVAGWLDLDAATLEGLALADDVLRGLVTVGANADLDAERWIVPTLRWRIRQDSSALRDGSAGPPFVYEGIGLYVDVTHEPRLDLAALQAGTQQVTLVPPADVVLGGSSYGVGTPLVGTASSDVEGTIVLHFFASVADLPLTGEADAVVSDPALPSGWWSLQVDGTEIGVLDLSLAAPRGLDGLPIGPYPVPEVTLAGDAVTGVSVQWRARAADGADQPLADDVVARLFETVGLGLEGPTSMGGLTMGATTVEETSGSLETGGPPSAYTPTHPWLLPPQHALSDLQAGDLLLDSLLVVGSLGSTVLEFGWTVRCDDADGDELSDCMGDWDDTDASVFVGAPEICDDGVDNDGVGGDLACAFEVAFPFDGIVPFVDDDASSPPYGFVPSTWTLRGASEAGLAHSIALEPTRRGDWPCGADEAWLASDGALPTLAVDGSAAFPLGLFYAGCGGTSYTPMPEPATFRYVAKVNRADGSLEGHAVDVTVTSGAPSSANTVAAVTFPTVPTAVGDVGEMQVTGSLQTAGRVAFHPLASFDPVSHGSVRQLDARIELRDGTGALATGLCADPACAVPLANPVDGRFALYAPAGTYSYTATFTLQWDAASLYGLRAQPLVWTTGSTGEHLHNPLDATWDQLPLVPEP